VNAAPTIRAILAADPTISSLLNFLPNDTRTVRVYTTWLTRVETPTSFMRPDVDTLWPSIFVSRGGVPTRHPQDFRVPGMTAMYPQVWVYMPMLRGIDFEDRSALVLQRARVLLPEDLEVVDPHTGLKGRLRWWGDQPGREADEYTSTWGESSMYEYRARWREED